MTLIAAPARWSLRRDHQAQRMRAAKLHEIEVREMRRWATPRLRCCPSCGRRLRSVTSVARELARRYHVSYKTVCDVLRNTSFYDPSYNWEVPHEAVDSRHVRLGRGG